jgi:hypothetical protein
MKTAVLLLSFLALAAITAAAQAVPHPKFALSSGSQASVTASQSQDNHLRGCLSGSKGNYTLIDHQGQSHKVTGDNRLLWDDVGHELDMTVRPLAGNMFQETEITDIASRCWDFHLN